LPRRDLDDFHIDQPLLLLCAILKERHMHGFRFGRRKEGTKNVGEGEALLLLLSGPLSGSSRPLWPPDPPDFPQLEAHLLPPRWQHGPDRTGLRGDVRIAKTQN